MNYRLKKAAPGEKAGSVGIPKCGGYKFENGLFVDTEVVENTPEWFEPEFDTLDSIIEEEYIDISGLYPSRYAKKNAKKVAEKYLSLKKEEMIQRIEKLKESVYNEGYIPYTSELNKAITIIKAA